MASVLTIYAKESAVDTLFGGSGDPFIYMAVGSSESIPTEGSSALGSEHGASENYSRINCIATTKYTYSEGGLAKTVTIEGTFGTSNINPQAGSPYHIKEVALYNAETGGEAGLIFNVGDIEKDNTKQVKFAVEVIVV
jgi:hypothetical protein